MRRVLAVVVMGVLPILINVFPLHSLYRRPEYKTVTVTIERHPDNRRLVISWKSATGISGSSSYQLEGEQSPTKFQKFIEVTPGDYSFQACLMRGTQTKCVSQPASVLGGLND